MMKLKLFLLGAIVCLAAALSANAADNPMMGTWKLNEAKSKLAPTGAKNETVVYEAAGSDIKCTIDGVDAHGKSSHIEWTGKFDGKDYALTGDPNGDMRAYKKTSERTYEGITKKDGKVVGTSRIAIADDGKTRTVTSTFTQPEGKKVHSVAFYDKQ